MTRGKYIVIEGPAGSGKTTQISELARRLQIAGLPFKIVSEPDSRSDLTAAAIKDMADDPNYDINPKTKVLLFNAARSQSLQIIKDSLEQGITCISDRNYLTTLAVQYYGRGMVDNYQDISKIIDFAIDGIEPDLCIVLDAPADILRSRLLSEAGTEESVVQDIDYLDRVRSGYLWEAHQRQLNVIFASEMVEKVSEEVWRLVAKTLSVREKTAAFGTPPASIKQILEEKNDQIKKISSQQPSLITTQQSTDISLEFKDASSLLAIKLQSGKLAPFLTNSSANFTYNQKDKNGRYKYYTPPGLSNTLIKNYHSSMKRIYDNYSSMNSSLTNFLVNSSKAARKDAIKIKVDNTLRAVLPVANSVDLSISGPRVAIEDIINNLRSDNLEESKTASSKALKSLGETKLNLKTFSDKAPKLSIKLLDDKYSSSDNEMVSLNDYYPKNELELIPFMLYPFSSLSLSDIRSNLSKALYNDKSQLFKSYFNQNQKQLKVLEKAHYTFDVLCDFDTFSYLQDHNLTASPQWQTLTPRYGYIIPSLVEKANLIEKFEDSFAESLKLHSLLEKSAGPYHAQYATLRGHKMRWLVDLNGLELIKLIQFNTVSDSHPGYIKLASQVKAKLTEVHPLLSSLVFSTK